MQADTEVGAREQPRVLAGGEPGEVEANVSEASAREGGSPLRLQRPAACDDDKQRRQWRHGSGGRRVRLALLVVQDACVQEDLLVIQCGEQFTGGMGGSRN